MEHGLREVKSDFIPWPKEGDEIKIINPLITNDYHPFPVEKLEIKEPDFFKRCYIGPSYINNVLVEPPKPKDYGVYGPNSLIIDFDAHNVFTIENSWFFYKNIKINAKECIENYINKKRKRERMETLAEEIIKNKKQKS